jgi:hypothetical protein
MKQFEEKELGCIGWFILAILATQEVEMGRIAVLGQLCRRPEGGKLLSEADPRQNHKTLPEK